MRLPRDLSGKVLAKQLQILGYQVVRQSGSHVRLSTELKGEHHLTIPAHDSLRVGTLNAIFSDISDHFGITKEELLKQLFG